MRQSKVKIGPWIVLLGFAACAPKVEPRSFEAARQVFETRHVDVDLGLGEDQNARVMAVLPRLTWSGENVSSAEILRASEHLMRLGRRLHRPRLEETGERLAQLFYRSSGTTTRVSFESSPYMAAAIGETAMDTEKYLDETRAKLIVDHKVIVQTLAASQTAYRWPKDRVTESDVLLTIERYLQWLLKRLTQLGVDRRVVDSIRESAKSKLEVRGPQVRNGFQQIQRAPTLNAAMQTLAQLLKELEVDLDPATQAQIERGAKLGEALDGMRTPQDALSVIIDMWLMLDAEEREARFSVESPELYKFLKNRSERDLRCLKGGSCGLFSGFILTLKKHLGVLPEIEDFGVEKLRAQLDEAARNALVEELQIRAGAFMPEIPNLVREAIDLEFQSTLEWMASIREDLPGFIRGFGSRWADQKLTTDGVVDLPGVESARARVRWRATGLEITGKPQVFETGAEVLGSSLALAAERLSRLQTEAAAQAPANLRYALMQMNKLLVMGGFRGPQQKPYPSYSIALDPAAHVPKAQPETHPEPSADVHLNLRSFLDSPLAYGVLDQFRIESGFRAVLPPVPERQVSVRAQAELLRGLTGMIHYLRDWETSSFDLGLGRVRVGDYVEGGPAGSITEKLFPKDMLLALAVGNAAVILQNMAKDLSPVFLANLQGDSSWANEFDRAKGDGSTMVGMVDIVDGKRQSVARAEDVARFGLAVLDFLGAIEGIQKTSSPPLIEGVEPQRPLDHLLRQAPELKQVVIGVANFLARHMQEEDGGIRASYDRARGVFVGHRRLVDQALAIRMLARASVVLDVKAYGTAAMDAYFFMNRRLWRPALAFYMREENLGKSERVVAPTPDEVVTVLESVEELVPLMTDSSREQWQKISFSWIQAFESF